MWELRFRIREATGWREVTEIAPSECITRKEALKLLSQRLAEVNGQNSERGSSRHVKSTAITFAEFVETDWRSYVENRKLKPSTLYSYRSMIDNYLMPEFGSMLIHHIGPEKVTSFFDRARKGEREKRKKYLLNLYALLRVMLEVAMENERIERSPVRTKPHRPVGAGEGPKKSALSADQIRKVLKFVPEEHSVLFTCVALTGLRVGELLALRWCNVDCGTRELRVTNNLWRGQLVTPKTEASQRVLHLPQVLASLLAERRRTARFDSADDFLFARADGSPQDPDYLRKQVLYPALKAAGIKREPRAAFICSGTQPEASCTRSRAT